MLYIIHVVGVLHSANEKNRPARAGSELVLSLLVQSLWRWVG